LEFSETKNPHNFSFLGKFSWLKPLIFLGSQMVSFCGLFHPKRDPKWDPPLMSVKLLMAVSDDYHFSPTRTTWTESKRLFCFLGFACSMLGKSKKLIFPNGGLNQIQGF